MISISDGGYWLVSRIIFIFVLPNPEKFGTSNHANWLYTSIVHDEDGQNASFDAGDQGEGEASEQPQFTSAPLILPPMV